MRKVRTVATFFFKCSYAVRIWDELGMSMHLEHLAAIDNARDAIRYILNRKKRPQLTMVIGMWTWWAERNRIREEVRGCQPVSLFG